MTKLAIYPGAFDPVTYGHLDLMERAQRLFDQLIVAVSDNILKTPLFTLEERMNFIRESTSDWKNIQVDSFSTLLVDYARIKGSIAIIRGLRAVSDFEYEFQMALMNRKLDKNIETVFLMPSEKYSFVSSRIVREIAYYGGNVTGLVPDCAVKALRGKMKKV